MLSKDGDWYKLKVNSSGTTGYVFAKYITIVSATPTPKVTPDTHAKGNLTPTPKVNSDAHAKGDRDADADRHADRYADTDCGSDGGSDRCAYGQPRVLIDLRLDPSNIAIIIAPLGCGAIFIFQTPKKHESTINNNSNSESQSAAY